MSSSSDSILPVAKYLRSKDEPRESADGGVGREAALENATSVIALEVRTVGVVDLVGGEHASEGKETVFGVFELEWDVDAIIHQAPQLRRG
jgi:hypothetical protein